MEDAPLLRAVEAALREVRADLPGSLLGAFDVVARGVGPRFLAVDAQPVVRLPGWLAPDLASEAHQRLVRSGVAGYLAFRGLDDWFDEGRGEPGEVMALALALGADHHAAIASVSASDAVLRRAQTRWARAMGALLDERGSVRSNTALDDHDFDRALDVSRPGLLPGAAALAATGRDDTIPAAEAVYEAFLVGHQRLEDLFDAPLDWSAGRRTYAARRAHTGPITASEFRIGAGWLEVYDEALSSLDVARGLAGEAGWRRWADALAARAADADARRRDLLGALGRRMIGPPRP